MVGEVFEQDARVLGLHFGQAIKVGAWHRFEIAAHVRNVHLGGGGPLLEVAQNLGGFVVHRTNQAMLLTPAFEVDGVALNSQPSRQSRNVAERPIGLFFVADRTKRVHVTVNAIVTKWLPRRSIRHTRTVPARPRRRASWPPVCG